jgi:decaprenyl-phosphate phosphoribosyltransferase
MIKLGQLSKVLRIRQWLKNVLIFFVPFLNGDFNNLETVKNLFIGFLSFSFIASAGYILNDWKDRNLDSLHPKKANRPFASGVYHRNHAILIFTLSLCSSVLLSFLCTNEFRLYLLQYFIVTVLYTFYIKKIPVIEVVTLASCFVIRILAGAALVDAQSSKSLLVVVTFAAIFVVTSKRFAEIQSSNEYKREVAKSYSLTFLQTLITTSLTLSIGAYLYWVFNQNSISGIFFELSTIPVTLALFRYAWHRDAGDAETPEEMILSDPLLPALASIIALLFYAAVYL